MEKRNYWLQNGNKLGVYVWLFCVVSMVIAYIFNTQREATSEEELTKAERNIQILSERIIHIPNEEYAHAQSLSKLCNSEQFEENQTDSDNRVPNFSIEWAQFCFGNISSFINSISIKPASQPKSNIGSLLVKAQECGYDNHTHFPEFAYAYLVAGPEGIETFEEFVCMPLLSNRRKSLALFNLNFVKITKYRYLLDYFGNEGSVHEYLRFETEYSEAYDQYVSEYFETPEGAIIAGEMQQQDAELDAQRKVHERAWGLINDNLKGEN